MIKKKRTYLPCRVCGCSHNNPSSSSICYNCGDKEYLSNLQQKQKCYTKPKTLREAFEAGWNRSAEGFNAEHGDVDVELLFNEWVGE